MMNRAWLSMSLLLVVGCNLDGVTDLDVDNQNEPDRDRVLADAVDLEALVGGSFQVWMQSTEWMIASPLSSAADETTWPFGNWNTGGMGGEPRGPWRNDRDNNWQWTLDWTWDGLYEALASLRDGLAVLDADTDGAFAREIDVDRARAFARFVQGISHGFLAMMFDSAFVLDETVDLENAPLVRVAYPQVLAASVRYLDDAIALAAGAGWELEAAWIHGNAYTASQFVGLVNGFKARYMSQVARTPPERNSVDWQTIVNAVNQNLGADVWVDSDLGNGWDHWMQYYGQQRDANSLWHRADYKILGYTDTSGRYLAWLAAPVISRDQFELLTPDARITGDPADGTVTGTDFDYAPSMFFRGGPYYQASYAHYRYEDYPLNGGPIKLMSQDAQQLIKAEGLLRLNQPDAAATIVNVTREGRGGLPPATGGDPDLMDKLIYEYLIENMNVCSGCAYFNKRGWGPLTDTRGTPLGTHHWGLVEGTQLHFAMPAAQLELAGQRVYTYGGVGNEGGTLGAPPAADVFVWPALSVYQLTQRPTLREKVELLRERARARVRMSNATRSLVRY